ncbi:MAG: 16S rRNA (cytidine(1402)-2'-O)-methyltransferase [Ignavibacteriaceae bacterium]|nr:16S rRNA (cytidine(1402)-2'-O)-methyltransferase [Ignavibacteriaceae bacterium]
MNGKLYIVSTPIGNYDDITLRALKILKSVDFIICEEFKEARRLLSHYQITKEMVSLNEHNEREKDLVNDILLRLVQNESAAIISDCGTPLFSDPGHLLVDVCISQGVEVVPVPGASSIMSALVGSGLDIEKFYYYGWLSPKRDIRKQQLQRLRNMNEVVVIMDTPYRLKGLLEDIVKIIGKNLKVVLAFQLTMNNEKFYRGTAEEILSIANQNNMKGEFVLLLNFGKR